MLLAVLARLAIGVPSLEHDPGRVRDMARDLLSRPPYREDAAGPVAQALRWLRRQLAEGLWNALSAIGFGTAGAWVVVVIGLAVFAVVVWYWTRGLVVDRSAQTVPSAPPSRTVDDWLREAHQHVGAERWREALRCRYGALIVALTDAGVIQDVPGRTVRELTAEVAREAPELTTVVEAVGRRFEAVWYGNERADEDDAEVAANAVGAVRRGRVRAGVPA